MQSCNVQRLDIAYMDPGVYKKITGTKTNYMIKQW